MRSPPPDDADVHDRAIAMLNLATEPRRQGSSECFGLYEEASRLFAGLGDAENLGLTIFNLAHAYTNIPTQKWYGAPQREDIAAAARLARHRALDKAEGLYQRAHELFSPADSVWRTRCIAQIGVLHAMRLEEAVNAEQEKAVILRHFRAAKRALKKAKRDFPATSQDAASTYHQLANVYCLVGRVRLALSTFDVAIGHFDQLKDHHGAAFASRDAALCLGRRQQYAAALVYAQRAVRHFESLGEGAAAARVEMIELVAQFEDVLRRAPET